MVLQEQLSQEIRLLMPNARLIYLFGSQASGQTNQHSDIDIAVLMAHKIDPIVRFDIQQTLAIKFDQDIDLVDLLSASTVLQNQVIQHGICLFGSQEEQDKFEMQVLSMYQRLNTERANILKGYSK
ncbi:type VII toxin-antitoxin system MntA family adenylyltransferase antitoxin [Marinomonas transparens]|uniref:Nucleotidyltransferase domain-containing protein n=1 Tax=Marinomonas transparens TaxID=2795388 RepID=A0A934MYH7_9GAMM|nr:nucleotidyltransferase domain-containing protein [Marinomonas transparens]MBJ7536470.1 nucleotidyltransferase domain-containing protein [Marinomonas transparens]